MWNSTLYIISMLATVALASFASYDPERERSMRGVLGIILFASLIAPVVNSLKSFSSGLSEYETYIPEEIGSSVLEESVEDGIRKAVASEFSLHEKNVCVECVGFNKNDLKAEKIRVILSGRAVLSDIPSIKKYVNGMGLGDCETEVNFEKSD